MSACAAPSTSAGGKKPCVYSQTPNAIALRTRRRAETKAENSLVPSPESHEQPTDSSEVAGQKRKAENPPQPSSESGDQPTDSSEIARQKRRKPDGYSQSKSAIASRKRQAEMKPDDRMNMLERQAKYAAVGRARTATRNQEGFDDLSDAGQQKLLADEEARVTRERATEAATHPEDPRLPSARIASLALRNQQHTAVNTDTTPTPSGNQQSLQQSVSTQPTVDTEVDQHITQPHAINQQGPQCLTMNYPHHLVLDLEPLVGDLSDRDARIASLLFGLVREDHDRSGDHVEKLCRLFALTRERLDTKRTVAEQKRIAFGEAEIDVLKYEAFVGDLEEGEAKAARGLFDLAGGTLKDRPELAALLHGLFSPLKQRNMDDHVMTSTFQSVFEKLDNAVNHNGNDAAQPT